MTTPRMQESTWPFEPEQVGGDYAVYEPLARCRQSLVEAQVHLGMAAEEAHAKGIDVTHILELIQRLRDHVRGLDMF